MRAIGIVLAGGKSNRMKKLVDKRAVFRYADSRKLQVY